MVGKLLQSCSSVELVFFMEDQVHGLEEQQDPMMGDGKRQKCDVGESQLIPQRTQVSYADIMQVESEGLEDGHWENLHCLAATLMEDSVKEQNRAVEDCVEEDTFHVEIDTKEYLQSFEKFYDKVVILFFYREDSDNIMGKTMVA